MQWGQIKTLFILSFLILDLFLLNQFLHKQKQVEIDEITTIEEDITTRLEQNNITISEEVLEADTPVVSGVTSERISFSDEVMSQIQQLKEGDSQRIELTRNGRVLVSLLEDPVEVTEDTLVEKVNEIVPFADQYSYWGWNKDKGVALFFQQVNDRTVYFNQGGVLIVNIVNNEMTSYAATLMQFKDTPEAEEGEEPASLTSQLTIIEKLFEVGTIEPGDKVTSMKVGYHRSLNLNPVGENGPQKFAPTWKISVEKGEGEAEDIFVYAIRGVIRDISEDTFIENTTSKFNFYDIVQNLRKETPTANDQISETGVSME